MDEHRPFNRHGRPGSKNWQGIVTKVKGRQNFYYCLCAGRNPRYRRVTLLIRKIESYMAATPAHNPAGPKNPIPNNSNVIKFYNNVLQHSGNPSTVNGALVGVHSKVPLSPRACSTCSATSYGDAVVYDAVGNVVTNDLHVYQAQAVMSADSTYTYGLYWDCHNRNGRWVGSGTYLIMVATTDSNQTNKTTPIKVGFSR